MLKGYKEGWIQNLQALGRGSTLPGSITHVCDENTGDKEAMQTQGKAERGVMAKELCFRGFERIGPKR